MTKEKTEKKNEVIEAITKVSEKSEPKQSKVSKNAKTKDSETESKELEKAAEKESLETEKKEGKSLEEKKKEILERVKKLKEKVTVTSTEELKEKIKAKRAEMLIPLDEYVKAGIYLGTKVVTPNMKPYMYRRRADGLAIFNTDLIDEKLKEGVAYLSKFNPEEIILVCKRQAGWKAANMFGQLTGIRVFTKKYPAGVLTNTNLPNFFENELTIIIDHWLDKNALNDTLKVNKKVLMICDTNNFSKGANQIIIGNNKSSRSLGIIFYLLTKGYCKNKGIKCDIPDLDWWTGEKEENVPVQYGV